MASASTVSSQPGNKPDSSSVEFQSRLNHLLQSGLFNEEAIASKTNGLRQYIKRLLYKWELERVGVIQYSSPASYTFLKANKDHQYQLPKMNYSELKDFRHFPTSQQHLEIKDEYGQLLAYRFRVPTEFADHLENSTSTLPPTKTHLERKINPRGTFPIRHYATWADFSTDIFYSGDYKKDLPYSAEWIQSNKSLWKYVGDRLKLISPESYSKLTNIKLPSHLELLCHPWSGTAINQDMTPNSTLQHHQDWRDIRSTPNAVIAWGNFTGGDLILWQLKVKVELKKGDCLLFWGSLIAHGNDEITEGTRHSVNMFTHKSNIDWIKRDPQNRYLKIGGQNKLPVTSKVEKDGKNKKKLKDGQDRGEGGSKKVRRS